jgi:hypothetical protein
MTIEFNTTYGKVSEKLLSDIRTEILKISHIHKKIFRAEVLLTERRSLIPGLNKICEIKFTMYGDDLFVHARTRTFENSAKEVIRKMKKIIDEHESGQGQKELSDYTISKDRRMTFASKYFKYKLRHN